MKKIAKPFYDRLRNYYSAVGKVLRGDAEVASIFPNTSDIGTSRERVYAEFLRLHAPSKCNVMFGGFLFDEAGSESKQVDVIVTTDTAPQFNFLNKDGAGKSFACVEGVLAVASVKSTLNRAELFDSLLNLASIPAMSPLKGRIPPNLRFRGYEDWPYKIIFASDGIAADTLLSHLAEFYQVHPTIPETRRPNIIHVAGKYFIHRIIGDEKLDGQLRAKGEFVIVGGSPDTQAIAWTLQHIQSRASSACFINFRYDFIVNNLYASDSVKESK